MRDDQQTLIAGGILLGSAIAFLAVFIPILRDPEKRELEKDYRRLLEQQSDLDTFVAGVVLFAGLSISLDMTATFVHHWRETGEVMPLEELERQYQ